MRFLGRSPASAPRYAERAESSSCVAQVRSCSTQRCPHPRTPSRTHGHSTRDPQSRWCHRRCAPVANKTCGRMGRAVSQASPRSRCKPATSNAALLKLPMGIKPMYGTHALPAELRRRWGKVGRALSPTGRSGNALTANTRERPRRKNYQPSRHGSLAAKPRRMDRISSDLRS